VPLNLFGRRLDAEGARKKLAFWFFLTKAALALAALADLVFYRQAAAASLFALAAAVPVEPLGAPAWIFAFPSGILAAVVLHREGIESVQGAVLGVFALSAALVLLGTLRRDARLIG